MTEIIPFTGVGQKEVGYVLVARLSKAAQAYITSLLHGIDGELPGLLWRMPPKALHSTLCEIFQPKDYGYDKTAAYLQHAQQYEAVVQRILAGLGRITVHFNAIEASPAAIIVRGQDDGSFNRVRTELADGLLLPAGTKRPPDIIHSSIARYADRGDLSRVQEVVKRYPVDFTEEITEFRLERCTVQPLLETETLAVYPLA
jgi:hypothetical protein